MKPNRNLPGLVLLALILFTLTARSEPRDRLPPWPEQTLAIFGFNETSIPMLPWRVALGAESAQMAESWSELALTRDAFVTLPVAIPVMDPFYRKRNFTTSAGTIRFWFRPEWSGANAGGNGPGGFARLLELVTVSAKEPETLWSLYFNPEGDMIYLSGMGVGGAMDFLKAEVKMTANHWHLISLNFDEKQTTLMVDATVVATGAAMPPVASWKADALGLVIGSDITGANPALGWFDELCTFEEVQPQADVLAYWKSLRWVAILGAVGTEKEEAVKQRWLEQLKLEVEGAPVAMPTIAYRPRPVELPTNALWLDISGVTNGVVTMRLQGTVPDVMYEIQSQEIFMTNAGWQSEGVWVGTADQDWTETPVQVGTRTNQLFMRARSFKDEDGNGLPDWWEMQVFGSTGNDGYADPDGDGWVNIQEYQNGTGPGAFNTPAAPQGVRVAYNSLNSAVTVSWLPSQGAVTGYVIERTIPEIGQTTQFTYGPNQTSHNETFPIANPSVPNSTPYFKVRALYALGNSQPSVETSLYDPRLGVQAHLTPDGNNVQTLVVSGTSPEVESVLLTRLEYDGVNFTTPTNRTEFSVAASNFVAGTFTLPTAWTDGYYSWVAQGAAEVGREGDPCDMGFQNGEVFRDGRLQLRQNLRFLLRAANVLAPFSYSLNWGFFNDPRENQPGYAYADFYDWPRENWPYPPYSIPTRPFYDNYDYRNFVLNATNVYPGSGFLTGWVDGFPNTRVGFDASGLVLYPPAMFEYLPDPGVTNVPAQVSVPSSRYLLQTWAWADVEHLELGVTAAGSPKVLTLGSNVRNIYGLPYLSMQVVRLTQTNGLEFISVPAGGSVNASTNSLNPGCIYPEVENPVLQNAGYYFCNPNVGPFPGYTNFSTTNQSPLLISSVGDPTFQVAGHAKYSILNGYTDKFAYLGQYFEKAYKANTNGTRSTNETGILSPYGEFFATEPGKTFLTTKPDGVSTNIGECVVSAIKLQLDVNHDGVMDMSWTGPDNTSSTKPFVFWVNNDYDRGHAVDCPPIGICDWEEDDVSSTDPAAISPGFSKRTVDADYPTEGSLLTIPCKRDLEDYTRLWIPGLAALYTAHSNLIFELSVRYGDTADGPALNLFPAIEANGGTNYLWNETMADLQVAASFGSFPPRISPTVPIRLNTMFSWLGGAGDYFILCGAKRGKGELLLTVSDSQSNLLAQTSAWIEFKDIKEMYERWTVGDNPSVEPTSTPVLAVEDLPVGVTAFQYSQPTDMNTPYILHVHGSNMERWEKDRFAEVMYKRLYWQGYQGRFGSFRWPTEWGVEDAVDAALDATFFDRIEFVAWKSAAGLKAMLTTLNNQYPGQVRMSSHSMGNVVAGEALRQCTNYPVAVYASFQGAVPSHSYDTNTPTRSLGLLGVQDDGTPNAYAHYWTSNSPSYFDGARGAAKYVNFFNASDYVLNGWQYTQNYKPDGLLGYTYESAGFGQPKYFRKGGQTPRYPAFPADTYELFSFCIEARCFALGAQANVGGQFFVAQTYQQVDLNTTAYSFGDAHKGHSGEFRSTNMKRSAFWDTFLRRLQLKE